MNSDRRLVVLKIGGSVLTFKDRPLSLRTSLLDSYADMLYMLWNEGYRFVLVLGGGSYGHYYVNFYRGSGNRVLVSKTSRIMAKLALIVQDIFESKGLAPIVYPPHAYCRPRGLIPGCNWSIVNDALAGDLLPITYGDVYPEKGGYGIVSGDELAAEAACSLRAERLVYATSVDGVYAGERLVEKVEGVDEVRRLLGYAMGGSGVDVTGGMARKLKAVIEAGCRGLRVYIVNGFRVERVAEAVRGGSPKGTIVNLG